MNDCQKIDKSILLEQYKLYVEMADRNSQRRHSANNYFLTINTFLFSSFALSSGALNGKMLVIPISLTGIVLCFVWHRLIKSYKFLNKCKFKVIHEMEHILGYAPFCDEWEKLERGDDKELYHPFTNIEPCVPLTFGLLYLIVFFMTIPLQTIISLVYTATIAYLT